MEIMYMKQMLDNSTINGFKNRPFDINKIEELEVKFNNANQFPKAFREFLFLGGEFNNVGFDDIDGIEELQGYAKEDTDDVSKKIKRPFFAFSVYNAQYSVIFLDEDKEDPKVYLISPFLAKGGSVDLIKPNGFIFSDLVNESIRRVKNNIPF